jgi:hypothetical protein
MAGIVDVMRDASGALDYAIDALEAPAGASIRDTARELKAARETVADMLAALGALVWQLDRMDDLPEELEIMVVEAKAAIAKAKGEA